MSVNYRHAVDVPVTDIEDPEDDIVFADYQRNNNEFLNTLDYEPPHITKKLFLSRIKSLIGSGNNKRTNEYEMLSYQHRDDNDSSFDLGLTTEPDNKKGALRNHILLLFVFIIAGALFASLYYRNLYIGATTAALTILSNSTHDFYPTTILVSLDGFHPHYISSHLTPNLHRMLLNDFGAPYMTPSFPSSTFPNHWTLVTGLYPSEHGVVGNTFFDPKLNKQFVNTNPLKGGLDPDFWRGGEPIWTTAKKQGLRTAVHMWPGSEVPGVGPTIDVDKYVGSEKLSSKVKKLMKWIDRDIKDRPQLLLAYVPTVDTYGHKYGIHGSEMKEALKEVDNFVGSLKAEVELRNLNNIVNLVFLSDHGMAPTSNDRLIYLDDLVDMTKIEHVDGWPLFGLRPKEGIEPDYLFEQLKDSASKLPHRDGYDIYKVEDIPEGFQFGGQNTDHRFNYRLAPIWIIPRVGYSITTHEQMKKLEGDYKPKGVHGYNNTEILMRALFVGSGPYFETRFQNYKVEPFNNVEVYGIICDSLNIQPSPNNGTNRFKFLDATWVDHSVYPGLDFEVQHLVENATYDFLWRPKEDEVVSDPTTLVESTTSETTSKPTDDIPPINNAPGEKGNSNLGELLEDIGDLIDGTLGSISNGIGAGIGAASDWLSGLRGH